VKCPKCKGAKWKTLETRAEDRSISRRRQCLGCEQRVWTTEKIQFEINAKPKVQAPKVVKEKVKKPKKVAARSFIKRNVDAMLKMESRRDSAMDYYSEDNDYLNKW
jgi:transcriptional regulator NrdR family protein